MKYITNDRTEAAGVRYTRTHTSSRRKSGRHGREEQRRRDVIGAGEAHRGVRQPGRAPRRAGPAPQGRPLRARRGGPQQQERAAAAAQPRPQDGPRAPPRRPLHPGVAHHRRVRRRGLPRRPAAPPLRPPRPRQRPLLGKIPRRGVQEAFVDCAVDGRRGAGGVGEGDEGEPDAAGGAAAGGEEVLQRRRHRLPRHRRRWGARALDGGGRGDGRRATAHRREPPGAVPLGEGRRDRAAVPPGQGPRARCLGDEEGPLCLHCQGHGSTEVAHFTTRKGIQKSMLRRESGSDGIKKSNLCPTCSLSSAVVGCTGHLAPTLLDL